MGGWFDGTVGSPGEKQAIGIEVESGQFPWLVVVDKRDRRAQLDARDQLPLLIYHVQLIGAQ
jgi:hypothetical protein